MKCNVEPRLAWRQSAFAQMVLLSLFLQYCASTLFIYVSAQQFSVNGRYIYNGDEVFTAMGIDYSPIPIGASEADEASDLGDVFSNSWNFIHDRDLPVLRSMGVNTLRIYDCYPWLFPSAQQPAPTPSTLTNHTDFLDKCWNGGVDPIFVWMGYHMGTSFHVITSDTPPAGGIEAWRLPSGEWASFDPAWGAADNQSRAITLAAIEYLATQYGAHPAVIGFVIGNEQNSELVIGSTFFWRWFDGTAASIKLIAPTKLTMTTLVDDNNESIESAEELHVVSNLDIWGINSYRGTVDTGFDILFSQYATISNKPLLITEYGPPASTRASNGSLIILPNNAEAQADYIEVHWDDIVAHRNICSGGYAFSWVDEWWKYIEPNEHNPSNATNGAYPGGQDDEEYFGMNGCELITPDADPNDYLSRGADVLQPRAAVQRLTELFATYLTLPIPPQAALNAVSPFVQPPPDYIGPYTPIAPVAIVVPAPQSSPPPPQSSPPPPAAITTPSKSPSVSSLDIPTVAPSAPPASNPATPVISAAHSIIQLPLLLIVVLILFVGSLGVPKPLS